MPDPRELIDGYFDDTLTADQLKSLSAWIKADPNNARAFAQSSLLHDRLRNTFAIAEEVPVKFTLPWEGRGGARDDAGTGYDGDFVTPASPSPKARSSPSTLPCEGVEEMPASSLTSTPKLRSNAERVLFLRTTAAAAVLVAGLVILWFSIGTPTATAAIRELDRIIVNSIRSKDRTYEIVVEDITSEDKGKRSSRPETLRPPKPPLDGATLYVRSGNQFVLIRKTLEGLPFITGSNGQQSWAINTRGPVRVSSDTHRFDHDLPGHETSVPLTNLHEGLQQLKRAYHLTSSSLGPEEVVPEQGHEARLLIAVKKPRVRGPQRVEIVYDSTTGRILRMRFIQMPYGPDRLDLRLSLLSEEELQADFFEHTSHHAPDRKIEMEN
jgi:hypothetical protein